MAATFLLILIILSFNVYLNCGSNITKSLYNDLIEELKNNPIDPNSFSRPDLSRVTNFQWTAFVNFEKQIIDGCVDLTVDKLNEITDQLILDIKDLKIIKIIDKETNQSLKYKLSEAVNIYGSKLTIRLLPKKRSIVSIAYKTSPNATALQWLKPEQTAGKRHPYLFSQCVPIHCRSMLPCQDTPAVKTPYEAKISVSKELVVLLSAIRKGSGTLSRDGLTREYHFKQVIPIPSYLIAIVVGDLVSKRIGPRSHVWSEPELIDRSAYEFAETEKMLTTAESIVGQYLWGVYDLLVLPPSFSFGGMENPCLTFITPTLIAGDRSMANVIAHEIAHSWTGNLVSIKNWGHFWLKEGLTTFIERKIVGLLSGGEPNRQFRAIEGLKELKYSINSTGANNPFSKLVIDMRGKDPNEVISPIPYEKGHTFLFYLEQKLGGPHIFEPFLKIFIQKNKFKSIDTNDFKEFIFQYFKSKTNILKAINWNLWLNGTGMPPIIPNYDKSLSKVCTELAQRWIKANESDLTHFSAKDISSMDSWQLIEFLNQLLESEQPISKLKVKTLTEIYYLRAKNNSEIKQLWLRLGLKAHWEGCVDDAIRFITSQGRYKYLKPIYRALYEWEDTRKLAIDTFKAHSNELMHMTASVVAKELHLTLK